MWQLPKRLGDQSCTAQPDHVHQEKKKTKGTDQTTELRAEKNCQNAKYLDIPQVINTTHSELNAIFSGKELGSYI